VREGLGGLLPWSNGTLFFLVIVESPNYLFQLKTNEMFVSELMNRSIIGRI
jgi:hypothetical protein